MRLCEIRDKEVINMCNCKKLGYVIDLEVDLCSGCIEAIIVPITAGVCGFFGSEMVYVIPLGCIRKIGTDIIMVEICEESCRRKE